MPKVTKTGPNRGLPRFQTSQEGKRYRLSQNALLL